MLSGGLKIYFRQTTSVHKWQKTQEVWNATVNPPSYNAINQWQAGPYRSIMLTTFLPFTQTYQQWGGAQKHLCHARETLLQFNSCLLFHFLSLISWACQLIQLLPLVYLHGVYLQWELTRCMVSNSHPWDRRAQHQLINSLCHTHCAPVRRN